MKELVRNTFFWFLGFFNFGIYMDDGEIDSLVYKLKLLNLTEEAEELSMVYNTVIINETLKTILMCVSLFVMWIVHHKIIINWFINCWQKIKNFCTKSYKFIKSKI